MFGCVSGNGVSAALQTDFALHAAPVSGRTLFSVSPKVSVDSRTNQLSYGQKGGRYDKLRAALRNHRRRAGRRGYKQLLVASAAEISLDAATEISLNAATEMSLDAAVADQNCHTLKQNIKTALQAFLSGRHCSASLLTDWQEFH